MGDPDFQARVSSLFLFINHDILRKQGVKDAIEAAKKGMEDADENVRSLAIELFQKLFEEKEGYEAAIEAFKKGVENSDVDAISSARELEAMLKTRRLI